MKSVVLQYEDIFFGDLLLVNEEHPLSLPAADILACFGNAAEKAFKYAGNVAQGAFAYSGNVSQKIFAYSGNVSQKTSAYSGNLPRRTSMYSRNLSKEAASAPRTKNHASSFMAVDDEYPDILLQKKAATVLSHVIQDIDGKGKIVPVSGYRSGEEQTRIWKDSIKENGEEFTRKYVALPGHSEHQTGLAIDLGIKKEEIDFICPDFPYEGICQRFRQTAPEYGFIERYEEGKESITKIAHEPWHFRYVGYPHSKIMKEQGVSLEEYIEMLKEFPMEEAHYFYEKEKKRQAEVFFVPLSKKKKAMLSIPEECLYQISGNNVDGCIVTIWRNEYA